MIAWRVRDTSRPITVRRIVATPPGMGTGVALVAPPGARAPLAWWLAAFLLGALVPVVPVSGGSRLDVALDDRRLRAAPAPPSPA